MNKCTAAIFSLALLAISSAALAKDKPEWRSWPLGQRLSIGVAGYRPNVDTKVTLDAGPIQGTIDFESDLGLSDREGVPIAALRWRFFKRHSLRVDYFQLDRSSFSEGPVNIDICTPPENPTTCLPIDGTAGVGAFIDTSVLNIGYDYSIFFNEKLNWSVGLGLSAQDFTLGVSGSTGGNVPASAETKFTAPLPSLATTFNYAFTDKWLLDLSLNWLEVNIDLDSSGKFDGRILGFDGGIRWQTWKNFGFNLGYTFFNLDLEIDDGQDIGGNIEYKYQGPRLGVQWYF
jgi:hypothetical protein